MRVALSRAAEGAPSPRVLVEPLAPDGGCRRPATAGWPLAWRTVASWTCLGELGSEHAPWLTVLRRDLSSRCPLPRSPLCACRAVMGASWSLAQACL